LEASIPETGVEQLAYDGVLEEVIAMSSFWGIKTKGYASELQRSGNLVADMGEFLKEKPADILEKSEWVEVRLAKKWKKHFGTSDEFYIGNREYLYDNIKYNAFIDYHLKRLMPLMIVRNQRTLDVGCGIGTLVFILCGQENEAVGYDINSWVVDFCNFKKKKYGLDAEFTTELPDLSRFDLVTALGMLEHLDTLQEFLLKLGKGMKTNARLFHVDDWGDQTISPMHFNNSKNIDNWLKDAGFTIKSERWAVKL